MMKRIILILLMTIIGFGVYAAEPSVGTKANAAVTASKVTIQRYDALIAAFDTQIDINTRQAQLDKIKHEMYTIATQISHLKYQVEQAVASEKQKFLDMLKQQVQAYKDKATELERFASQQ